MGVKSESLCDFGHGSVIIFRMSDDAELLRQFVQASSEEAFAELVKRRVGFVYSIALWRTRDAHRAEDAAQTVFVALARNAGPLSQRPVLLGWLHQAASNAATDIVRSELSRAAREREAHTMHDLSALEGPVVDWEKVRPVLDASLSELTSDDRDAVLLRFYEGQKYADIGRTLHISENTARMRVERALDKLQSLLVRRGIVSTSAALSTALAQQGVATAPAGLAEAVIRAAQLSAPASGALQPSLWKIIMNPKILSPAAGVALLVGLTVNRPRAETAPEKSASSTTSVRSATPNARVAQVKADLPPPGAGGRALNPEAAARPELPPEVIEERAIRNNLRRISAARDAFLKFQNRLPESLEDLVGPTKLIRELKPVKEEDYATVKLDSRILAVQVPGRGEVTLTTEGPQRRGPPTLQETAVWESALGAYLTSRPAGTAPRLPGPSSGTVSERKLGPEFAGLMASGANHVFIVEDEKGNTQWVKLGQRIGPYVVSDYRASDETLILKNGDAVLPLTLRKTKASQPSHAVEVEIAFLALQEVTQREGWPASAMSVQKPQLTPSSWFVGMYRVIERTEHRVVPGEQIFVHLNPDGTLGSYKNHGVRKPEKN